MPLTKVRLLEDVDIDSTYKDSFTFDNESLQFLFFLSKLPTVDASKYFRDELTYQRKEQSILWSENVESLYNVNYMMFQNSDYGDKWFYAFIKELVYENKSTTRIIFEVDEIQTWLFDVELQDCFIERSHAGDDFIGSNTVEENLNIGDLRINSTTVVPNLGNLTFVVATTADLTGADVQGQIVTSNYTGVTYYCGDSNDIVANAAVVNAFIQTLQTANKIDAIIAIFTMPVLFVTTDALDQVFQSTSKIIDFSTPINSTTIDGYTPRNKKLLTYPYNFLKISNNQGAERIYKYEFSDSTTMDFTLTCDINPNPTVYLRPESYNGGGLINADEVLTLGNYPACTWVSDYWTNWQAQNQVKNAIKIGSSFVGLGKALVGGISGAIDAATNVANLIGTFEEARVKADTLRGELTGSGAIASGLQTFSVYNYCVKAEIAFIIDDYFDRYGYKQMRSIQPALKNRTHWNYFKMLEVNMKGNIPNKSKERIIKAFKDGVTFWHTDNVGNYSLTNSII